MKINKREHKSMPNGNILYGCKSVCVMEKLSPDLLKVYWRLGVTIPELNEEKLHLVFPTELP